MSTDNLHHLKKTSDRLLSTIDMDYVRVFDFDTEARLIILKGFRGVGKTTFLLQKLNLLDKPETGIFLSLDNIHFAENKLYYTIDALYEEGYRVFVLDEVHKYADWSRELKNIYDSYPDTKVWATSSSALDIYSGVGDLSRRAQNLLMTGLSFREYLMYEHKIDIPSYTFDELLENGINIYEAYYTKYDLSRKFNAYLKKGYYPYYKESKSAYYSKMMTTLNQVIEIDLPAIFNIDYESTRQIKKLLSVISKIAPFEPNITKLSRDLKMTRNMVLKAIDIMAHADVISVITSGRKSDSAMTKPDKILLNNTNMLYALSTASERIGTIRETFVVNALKNKYPIATPAKGDILLDGKYTVEIGGKSKMFSQIYDMPNPVLIKDGVEEPRTNVVPIWMLGLL